MDMENRNIVELFEIKKTIYSDSYSGGMVFQISKSSNRCLYILKNKSNANTTTNINIQQLWAFSLEKRVSAFSLTTFFDSFDTNTSGILHFYTVRREHGLSRQIK